MRHQPPPRVDEPAVDLVHRQVGRLGKHLLLVVGGVRLVEVRLEPHLEVIRHLGGEIVPPAPHRSGLVEALGEDVAKGRDLDLLEDGLPEAVVLVGEVHEAGVLSHDAVDAALVFVDLVGEDMEERG
uniref:Uncharacterized protein n=1 Tax=Arcella intermedia TaxID=1963864 RepID=A0A6B2LR62_9EUKA